MELKPDPHVWKQLEATVFTNMTTTLSIYVVDMTISVVNGLSDS